MAEESRQYWKLQGAEVLIPLNSEDILHIYENNDYFIDVLLIFDKYLYSFRAPLWSNGQSS